jgi:HEAT repeat protein
MPAAINPYALVRRIIVAALTGTLPDEYRDDSVHILTQALSAPDEDVRALAVIGLSEFGVAAPAVLPALTGAMHDGSDQVRRRAVRSLGDFGRAALPSLPHLVCALDDSATCVRMEAMSAIGRIGPDAEPAIPHIIPLLADEDVRVRTVAGATLKKIGSASVPLLVEALADPDAIVRERAAILLGQLRAADDQVIEGLFEALSDFDEDVRLAARQALKAIETCAPATATCAVPPPAGTPVG